MGLQNWNPHVKGINNEQVMRIVFFKKFDCNDFGSLWEVGHKYF